MTDREFEPTGRDVASTDRDPVRPAATPGRASRAAGQGAAASSSPVEIAPDTRDHSRPPTLRATLDTELRTLVAHVRRNLGSPEPDVALGAIDTRVEVAFMHVPAEQHEVFRTELRNALGDEACTALGALVSASGAKGERTTTLLGAQIVRARPAEAPIQLDVGSAALDGDHVGQVAASGVGGAGGTLPHLGAIQKSFGHHDVSGVSAHVGGKAAEAASAIGARAYATGNSVAFASSPDLHTAAHEAAHVVQQRGGVRLAGGVGRAGDAYEQHADAVADRVVRGESTQSLLDTMAHRGASGGSAVQLLVSLEGSEATSRLSALIGAADARGLQTIRTAMVEALQRVRSTTTQRAGVSMVFAGETYHLEVPLRDMQTLADQLRSARPQTAAARDRALAGAASSYRPEAPHRTYALEGGREFMDTGMLDTEGFGQLRIRGEVAGAVDVTPEHHAEAPELATGVESETSGGYGQTAHGHREISGSETGLLRDWLMPQCRGFADRVHFTANSHALEIAAGGETGTVHLGPFSFHFSIDLVEMHADAEGRPGHRLAFTPPSITLHNEIDLASIVGELPGPIASRFGHSRVGLSIQWVPPWQQILRNLGIGAADAGAAATVGTGVTADAMAVDLAAGASTTSVAAAVALPVLAGVVIVGGTMLACAEASEAGAEQGDMTFYVQEYAAEFGDGVFHGHEGHSGSGFYAESARWAGQARVDAREALHTLSRDQKDALRVEYRTHEALAQAVARIIADRLHIPFDVAAQR